MVAARTAPLPTFGSGSPAGETPSSSSSAVLKCHCPRWISLPRPDHSAANAADAAGVWQQPPVRLGNQYLCDRSYAQWQRCRQCALRLQVCKAGMYFSSDSRQRRSFRSCAHSALIGGSGSCSHPLSLCKHASLPGARVPVGLQRSAAGCVPAIGRSSVCHWFDLPAFTRLANTAALEDSTGQRLGASLTLELVLSRVWRVVPSPRRFRHVRA